MADIEKVKEGLRKFHNPYTCAQTVYAACAEVDDEKMIMLKANSAGRAPNGICGALYAAMLLSKKPREQLVREFTERTGSTICREIKNVHKTPCEACVRVALEIL